MSKKYRNVVSQIVNTPWLISQSKAEEIANFLTHRLNSEDISLAGFELADSDEDDTGMKVIDGVAVISSIGVLSPRINLLSRISGGTSTQILANNFLKAAADSKVKTIIHEVDSPGGAAAGVPEAAEIIARVAQQKRVVTIARNEMQSGGLWLGLASGPGNVFATPGTTIGSLGAYTVLADRTKQAENDGIKYTVVSSGKYKTVGGPYEELTPEGKSVIQDRVDAINLAFVSAVAGYRGISNAEVDAKFGQGKSFLASEAAERGMVDGVVLFEDLLDRERSRARSTVSVSIHGGNEMMITERIRAALFARGLTSSVQASDEVCTSALTAYCAALGQEVGDTEDKILGQISQLSTKPEARPATSEPGHDAATVESARIDAAREERRRVCELQARGDLLGIDSDTVTAAIDAGTSVETALLDWTSKLGNRKEDNPLNRIEPGVSQSEKFVEGAVEAMAARAGLSNVNQDVLSTWGRDLRFASAMDLARQCIIQSGSRPSGDPEADAVRFLQMGGSDLTIMTAGAVDSPSRHPNLLSALANKALDSGYAEAPVQYRTWCEKLSDMTDFKPRTILETGIFGELDLTDDDQDVTQKLFYSQLSAVIQQERYRNAVALTVRMLVDDDMDGFMKQLRSLPAAGERTLNNLAVRLLQANTTMIDGAVQFAAGNLNLIASGGGGAPSNTELSDHRRLHRLQKNLGPEGQRIPVNLGPDTVLVPAQLEDAVLKALGTTRDGLTPAVDTNMNTVRGTIRNIVVDAYLDEFSTQKWWTFINPSIHGAFGYAHMRGYGAGGRRSTWFDNGRATRFYDFEARFAVCAKSRVGIVQNDGA